MPLDNMGRATQNAQYAQATGILIRLRKSVYDDCSRVYQSMRYGVDPSAGTIGNSLVDNTWYDGLSHVIMSLPAGFSAFNKWMFDGAGRSTVQYLGYYATAGSSSSSSGGDLLPLASGRGPG